MSTSPAPTAGHAISLKRDLAQAPATDGWVNWEPTGFMSASCTCGALNTGLTKAPPVLAAAREHAARYLPGFLSALDPVHPDEEPT